MCLETWYFCQDCNRRWAYVDRCDYNPNQTRYENDAVTKWDQCERLRRDVPNNGAVPGEEPYYYKQNWLSIVSCRRCFDTESAKHGVEAPVLQTMRKRRQMAEEQRGRIVKRRKENIVAPAEHIGKTDRALASSAVEAARGYGPITLPNVSALAYAAGRGAANRPEYDPIQGLNTYKNIKETLHPGVQSVDPNDLGRNRRARSPSPRPPTASASQGPGLGGGVSADEARANVEVSKALEKHRNIVSQKDDLSGNEYYTRLRACREELEAAYALLASVTEAKGHA